MGSLLRKYLGSPSPRPFYSDVEMVMLPAYELNLLRVAAMAEDETERKQARDRLLVLYAWTEKK